MNIIRRAILAFALIAGLSPAIAQVPPPVPALPDTERRTAYSISGSTCVCSVNFALYGDSTDYANWLTVWVNGVQIAQSGNWTIASPSGSLATLPRPITDAILTFSAPQTGMVQIVGARRPRRTSEFSENRGVAARDMNQILNDLEAQNREAWDFRGRIGVITPPGDPPVGTLPPATTRSNTLFGWDASGNPTVLPFTLGTLPPPPPSARTRLAVPLTLHVNNSLGTDSGGCGQSTGAAACHTLQYAITQVCTVYDLAGQTLTVVTDNAAVYTENLQLCQYTNQGIAAQGTVVVQGQAACATTLTSTSGSTILGIGIGSPWTFKNFQINAAAGTSVYADTGTFIALDGDCFGAATNHVIANNIGARVEFINSPYTVNGSAVANHAQASYGGWIVWQPQVGIVTITGTPSFGATGFVNIQKNSILNCQDITFTGAVAGGTVRYTSDASSTFTCGKTGVSSDPNTVLPGSVTGAGLGTPNQILVSGGAGNGNVYANAAILPTTKTLSGWSGGVATTSNSTQYIGASTISNAENNWILSPFSAASTNVNYLTIFTPTPPGAGQSYTFTLRFSGAGTALTCTISGAAAQSCQDISHTANMNLSAAVGVQVVSSAAAATTVVYWGMQAN